jgi:adenylosuccinate lyase
MRSERISSLAKYVISSSQTGALVFATQWFERTLDDSASKRLSIPQAFLAVDAILIIWLNIMDGVVVYPKVIEANIQKELPFMATENIIMESVKKGMDRQEVHEIIRELSMEETKEIKLNGNPNRLIDRIIKDGRLGLKAEDMEGILVSANYTGFAGQQTEDFVKNEIDPILDKYKDEIVEDREELRV